MKWAMFIENVRIALKSIRTNLLRTILTILIIAFGIMALVGILTAIDSIKCSLTESFSLMGANTFTIESRCMRVQIGNQSYRRKNHEFISHKQAQEFKDIYELPGRVSVWTRHRALPLSSTNPINPIPTPRCLEWTRTIFLRQDMKLRKGGTSLQVTSSENASTVIIGADVASEAFEKNQDPLNRFISVGNGRYRVVGVLKSRGQSGDMGTDRTCLIPYTNVRQYFSRPQMRYSINVMPSRPEMLDISVSEAEGIFRRVRSLDARDESDFNITQSDQLAQMLIENMKICYHGCHHYWTDHPDGSRNRIDEYYAGISD